VKGPDFDVHFFPLRGQQIIGSGDQRARLISEK
jgi:hypothetical protein